MLQAPPPPPAEQRTEAVEEMENGRCPVSGQTIPQEPEFFAVARLGGRAYRYAVCCAACKQDLERKPSAYLHPDGRPKREDRRD
jgi:RNA polymerase-binding transcription factor DksA